jgi:hypothetical protein
LIDMVLGGTFTRTSICFLVLQIQIAVCEPFVYYLQARQMPDFN